MRGRRGFTLVEMLVVTAIVVVLLGLTVGGLRIVRNKAMRAKARGQLGTIQLALSAYDADLRRLPRLAPRTGPPEGLLRDDGPALFAALQNDPTPALGGGPSSQYVKVEIGIGRIVDRTRLEAVTMGLDGETGVTALGASEMSKAATAAYQAQHLPSSAEPLVFLDPWGNPWHYREWRSVSDAQKDPLRLHPITRSGFTAAPGEPGDPPVAGPIDDAPHDPFGYDLWSNGPNGVNEFGAGDDVASWSLR